MQMMAAGGTVDGIAHLIQVALAPVFLLSGIGVLLSLFNTRLARVSDHIAHITELLAADQEDDDAAALRVHLRRLRRRTLALDTAMVMGGLGGAATCGAAMALFAGGLGNVVAASALLVLFGAALGCTVAALAAFIGDTILAWHGLRMDGPLPHMRHSGA